MSADELVRARSVAEEYLAIAADSAGPTMQWSARAFACQFHLHAGDLPSAAAENDVALEFGLELGAVDCESWWAATASIIMWLRDADHPGPDLAGEMADQFPRSLSWRSSQAFGLAVRGRLEECRALIDAHGLDDPMSFPMDMFWLSSVHSVAYAIGMLDDAALAHPLLAAAEPYAEYVCHYGVGLFGPMRDAVALLRTASGDADGGITEARAALDWATRHRLDLWRVMYQIGLAELLVRRGSPADLIEARTVLAETLPEAERLGMVGWTTRGAAVLDDIE